jgi:hypothetical protein
MAWRLHLSNQTIDRIDFLPTKPIALAVWPQNSRVHFLAAADGARLQDVTIEQHPEPDADAAGWREFLGTLKAFDGKTCLPFVPGNDWRLYSSVDGEFRVVMLTSRRLLLDHAGQFTRLKLKKTQRIRHLAMSPTDHHWAILDKSNDLNLYEGTRMVNSFPVEIEAGRESAALLAVSGSLRALFVYDGRRLLKLNRKGRIQAEVDVYYRPQQLACSPSGKRVVTTDLDAGIIRIYRGDDMTLTHQRFAIDLVAMAQQVQLMAELPPVGIATHALAATDPSLIAFSMSGIVCLASIDDMAPLPALT